LRSFKKPVVRASVLAAIFVLLGLSVPQEIKSMVKLIGSSTSGVALFVSGLITVTYHVKVLLVAPVCSILPPTAPRWTHQLP
jgi:malonate transporter and related proteins